MKFFLAGVLTLFRSDNQISIVPLPLLIYLILQLEKCVFAGDIDNMNKLFLLYFKKTSVTLIAVH